MPVQNKYLIENKKPVELVQELKEEYKTPSFDEFMKTYNENEKVIDNYQGEFEGYEDMRIKGTYYGPGFWDDIKGIVKPVASGVLIAASVFPPTAAVAAPVAYTVIGTGAVSYGIGNVTDNEGLKEAGKEILEIGMGARDVQEGLSTPDVPLNQYARSKNRR